MTIIELLRVLASVMHFAAQKEETTRVRNAFHDPTNTQRRSRAALARLGALRLKTRVERADHTLVLVIKHAAVGIDLLLEQLGRNFFGPVLHFDERIARPKSSDHAETKLPRLCSTSGRQRIDAVSREKSGCFCAQSCFRLAFVSSAVSLTGQEGSFA